MESERSAQTEHVGALAHECNDVSDVLIDRKVTSSAFRRSSRLIARAKALSFIRFITEAGSRSSTLFDGRTSEQAVTKPDISSHA
jgi:hypothetical protein